MADNLLSSFGAKGVSLGLDTIPVDINDTALLSLYFNVVEFNSIFTSGKNSVSFNGSSLLLKNSQIKVECIDSAGNSLFLETPDSVSQFSDSANFLVSISIFNEAQNGAGKFILVGTTTNNEIVRWIGNIIIDKTVQNSSKVRFYNTPQLQVLPLLYPIVSTAVGSSLTYQYVFEGTFSSYAVTPTKDTNQKLINPKTTDIDYRLVLNDNSSNVGPQLYPTKSFNSQMIGQNITVATKTIQSPYSYKDAPVAITASFTIANVIDSKTIQLNDAFYYNYGQNKVVSNINAGNFTSSYKWVAYNTASNTYAQYVPISGSPIFAKQSYAQITYQNLNLFSGYIARHKLYAKSLIYPGSYTLIVDGPLGASEILVDPITANKTYANIGSFYNQNHVNQYWFSSTGSTISLALSQSVSPMIDAMTISSPAGTWPDGNNYVIAKTTSPNIINDAVYYPYDSASYSELTSSAYNSNFVNLKGGALHVLSANITMTKNKTTTDASVSFYFTSSIPSILTEKNYHSPFGLLLGEITASDITSLQTFANKQMMYFTPNDDYYGTLVIVPYKCNVNLSQLSLMAYGDYGFSPGVFVTNIPFPINVANEGYSITAELFDINSALVYSGLQTVQSFDPNGESLFVYVANNTDPTKVQFISQSLTISQSLFLPNIAECPSTNVRLMGWNVPIHSPPLNTEGSVCYTNIDELAIASAGAGTSAAGDYITVGQVNMSGSGQIQSFATALNIKYDGTNNLGRKIIINSSGTKTTYP